ncbi:hypothetical protein [Haloarcula marina]|uniref:hypothetical protein n=1 Tax=Haloarcula marina TaxID=2961574 RepID=UPI0020B65CFD|nr:hypothetical protein [Halomicroarcula marina]
MNQSPTTTELLLQFLSLFVPALLAVVGSYCVYAKKQNDKEKALKSAIRTEIESAERLEHIGSYLDYKRDKNEENGENYGDNGNEQKNLPYSSAVSTSLYEGQSFELGLLGEKERTAVVNYYSNAIILNDMVSAVREFEANGEEFPSAEYDYMKWQLDRVRGLRKSALIHLDSDEVPEDTNFD